MYIFQFYYVLYLDIIAESIQRIGFFCLIKYFNLPLLTLGFKELASRVTFGKAIHFISNLKMKKKKKKTKETKKNL